MVFQALNQNPTTTGQQTFAICTMYSGGCWSTNRLAHSQMFKLSIAGSHHLKSTMISPVIDIDIMLYCISKINKNHLIWLKFINSLFYFKNL